MIEVRAVLQGDLGLNAVTVHILTKLELCYSKLLDRGRFFEALDILPQNTLVDTRWPRDLHSRS